MNTAIPLLNRDAAIPPDGHYQIARKGEYPIQTTLRSLPNSAVTAMGWARGTGDTLVRIVQVIDDDALAALANSVPETELLVDYDHLSHDPDKPTRAAGWMGKPVVRDGALYAPIAWTNRAEIESRQYRFFSPEFASGDTLVHLGENRFRVTRLTGGALTNRPNIRDIAALSNRDDPDDHTKTPPPHMKDIAKALGLAEDATAEQILAAIGKLKTDSAKETDLKNKIAALETEVLANRKKDVAALCDKHGITDATKRTEFETLYLANREVAEQFLAFLPAKTTEKGHADSLTNRHPAKTPAGTATAGNTGEVGQHEFLNRARAISAERKLTLADAITIAAGEEPDLYNRYSESLTAETK